jgi:transcriptional regulator with XRE-family HTH domain
MPKSQKTGSEALGLLIRARRQALGMRRRDLVDATGLSYPYVSQIETGYRLPSDRALRDLAIALQMDAMELGSTFPPDRMPSSDAVTPSGMGARTAWHANPSYNRGAPAFRASTTGVTVPEVVREAIALMEQLAPEDRLDALAMVQRDLVDRLVNPRREQRP